MAAYATVEDVQQRWPLIQRSQAVTVDDIESIIAAEQSIVDLKLSGRYGVPFNPVPAVIQTITADLATYRLITTRLAAQRTEKESDAAAPFLRSLTLLDDLAYGKIDRVTDSGTALASRTDPLPWSNTTGTPLFRGQPFETIPDTDLFDNWRTTP
jgi:phage gp36-like protein